MFKEDYRELDEEEKIEMLDDPILETDDIIQIVSKKVFSIRLKIIRPKKRRKVVAVGTSTVRSLETVVVSGFQVTPKRGWTDKFIYPPYDFKMVDALITNFHQPKSTLLMMVSAFASRKLIMQAYNEAKKKKYRFLSYGDAMLIL